MNLKSLKNLVLGKTCSETSHHNNGLGLNSLYKPLALAAVFSFLFIFLLSGYAAAQPSPSSCSGMVSYWTLNEGSGTTAADPVGGNDGTLYNGSSSCANGLCPTWTSGQVGGALSFDGEDDYIKVGDSSDLKIENTVAVEAWVNLDSIGDDKAILGKGGEGGSERYALDLMSGKFRFFVRDDSGTAHVIKSSTSPSTDTWYHVVGTYDGSDLKIYVDETQENSKNIGSITLQGESRFLGIGARPDDPAMNHLKATIDEVAIYNQALTADEIEDDYYAGLAGHNYCEVPNEVWVDNSFDSSTDGWQYDHFDSIQDGIDAVAEGGTVEVAAGTYNENINIVRH